MIVRHLVRPKVPDVWMSAVGFIMASNSGIRCCPETSRPGFARKTPIILHAKHRYERHLKMD